MSYILVTLVICCVIMVIALVPYAKAEFSRAIEDAGTARSAIRRKPRPMSRVAQVSRALFFGSWMAIIALAVVLLLVTPNALTPGNVIVLVTVIGGWWMIFGGIMWFARALARADAGSAVPSHRSEARITPVHAADLDSTPAHETQGAARAGPMDAIWCWGGILALFLVIYSVGAAFPTIARWAEVETETRVVLLIVAACAGGFGFLLFWIGVIALVLQKGHPTTEEDARHIFRNRISRGGLFSWSKSFYRFRGDAFSRSVSFDFTAVDIKRAWDTGAWHTDPTWRAIYALLVGVAVLSVAATIFLLVFASPTGKAFILAVIFYTILRLGWAFSRT